MTMSCIRKKYLPEPNPQRVELATSATLMDVFKNYTSTNLIQASDSMSLVDSAGVLIPIQDKDLWLLSSFFQRNHLQASRYKLYVAVKEEVNNTQYVLECLCLSVYSFETYLPNSRIIAIQ